MKSGQSHRRVLSSSRTIAKYFPGHQIRVAPNSLHTHIHTHTHESTNKVTAACDSPVHHRHTLIYIYDVQPLRFQRLRLTPHTVRTPATSSRESMLARQTAGVRLSWLTGVRTYLPTYLPTWQLHLSATHRWPLTAGLARQVVHHSKHKQRHRLSEDTWLPSATPLCLPVCLCLAWRLVFYSSSGEWSQSARRLLRSAQ